MLAPLRLFSTCPQSRDHQRGDFLSRVIAAARWCDRHGYQGTLVYTDNSLVDPWLVAQTILHNTTSLAPLVAVQPVYMHPYAVAKMVASLTHFFGRRLFLNMVAGGFRNDLIALGDDTEHDQRYDRLGEYTAIVLGLLRGRQPYTFEGRFYRVRNLLLQPAVAAELVPGILLSGSSPAGIRAGQELGATVIKYPERPETEAARREPGLDTGVRVGVIARDDPEEAWRVAHARFPPHRAGQITHQLAMRVSDSQWHHLLSRMAAESAAEGDPYWLLPFENYKTFCPYLVGSYQRVGSELARYVAAGFTTFILDIPPSQDEVAHTALAFESAREQATA